MFPAASICAEGSGSSRRPPATRLAETLATCTAAPQLAPPSVDEKDSIAAPTNPPKKGTITVPLGCTSGCPPIPLPPPPVPLLSAGAQVWPPSVDVDIQIMPP